MHAVYFQAHEELITYRNHMYLYIFYFTSVCF